MKTGIVDVGGGMRGVYACGVWDYCLDQKIGFDLGIGISAGSANLSSYMAGQRGRNYVFFTEYTFRRKYMGLSRFLLKHSFIDLDYIYGTMSNSDGENPLDYPALEQNPMEWYIVAADAETGDVRYFDRRDISQDNYSILKASSAIPYVCHPYLVDGRAYYDGALGDPVPLQKALDCGCDRVVLVLTKPVAVPRTSDTDNKLAAHIQKRYPKAAEQLRKRAERYNSGIAWAQQLAAEGKVLIVAPDDTCGVETLTRDKDAMKRLYEKGYSDAERITDFLGQGDGHEQ